MNKTLSVSLCVTADCRPLDVTGVTTTLARLRLSLAFYIIYLKSRMESESAPTIIHLILIKLCVLSILFIFP